MFGLFGSKKIEVYVPVAGKVIDITQVQDAVFSAKLLGDGFAVEPAADCITAPCDGTVALLAGTNHAVALEKEGVQLLIHIGLDTVELGGEGFTAHVRQNDRVKQGDKLITFDRELIKARGKQLTTMLVLTNMDEKVKHVDKDLAAGTGPVMVVAVK